jgi:putative heme iron utilization protein
MDSADADVLRSLIEGERILALGVLVDGGPYVGLVPFALAADGCALYIHTSALARHSRGLTTGAPFSALVHAPDDPGGDPLQVPRLTLNGSVRPLGGEAPEHQMARAAYLARFPESEPTFGLGDFGLHALEITGGRLVVGFARARNISRQELRELGGR